MGGSGGGWFPSSKELRDILAKKREADQLVIDSEVNRYLQEVLIGFNDRDARKTQRKLEQLKNILGEQVPIIQFLLGGSVAKHTFVDGLSDIDALVILDREELTKTTPRSVLKTFHRHLQDNLTSDIFQSIEVGRIAVTVRYRDGSEIQLLPAVRAGGKISIPGAQGKKWNETNPKAFQRLLTNANDRLNGSLIPTIKLIKSINTGLPVKKQLTGYHIEALCIEAAKGYRGSKTPKALLHHFLEQSSKRVLSPISDITNQSRVIDEYLGTANSAQRRIAADALASVARKLNAATSIDLWKETIGN